MNRLIRPGIIAQMCRNIKPIPKSFNHLLQYSTDAVSKNNIDKDTISKKNICEDTNQLVNQTITKDIEEIKQIVKSISDDQKKTYSMVHSVDNSILFIIFMSSFTLCMLSLSAR